jgi:hypothetical protein
MKLLQLGVLGFRTNEDGDVGIAVFPEREEILIRESETLNCGVTAKDWCYAAARRRRCASVSQHSILV